MKTNQKTFFSVLFLFILTSFFFLLPLKANDFSYNEGLKILETIPILNQGRAKPLDTFARESLRKITGGLKFEGKSALENILSWMLNPNQSYDQPVIVSKHKVLNEKLGIQVNAKVM